MNSHTPKSQPSAWLSATPIVLSLLFGCTSMGFGWSEPKLKEAVSFETECPAQKVKVVEALEGGTGHTKFRLDVCGKEQRWNRYGASYFPEGKGPMD